MKHIRKFDHVCLRALIAPCLMLIYAVFFGWPEGQVMQARVNGKVATISAGANHTCALDSEGIAWCWGKNDYGQLGSAVALQSFTPVRVKGLSSELSAISVGGFHTCALTRAGAVKCWGNNSDGQLGSSIAGPTSVPLDVIGVGSDVIAISSGAYHTCAVTRAGAAKCWGKNFDGQLGNNSTANSFRAVDVNALGINVVAVASGTLHSCALSSVGKVLCWGKNIFGQLGTSTVQSSIVPVEVVGLSSDISTISAGAFHTCALTRAGAVRCWGNNSEGQLGVDGMSESSAPVEVPGLAPVSAISTGYSHTCVVMAEGAAKCWGRNEFGKLGNGDISATNSLPVDVKSLDSKVANISTGWTHTCAVTTSGLVKCWGRNLNGQVGAALATDAPFPIVVGSFEDLFKVVLPLVSRGA